MAACDLDGNAVQAGSRARGSTIYLNLEPHCHHGRDHTLNARIDESVSTWRRATLMAMRFKVEIYSAAACARSSLLKGQNFGVLDPVIRVEAFSNELSSAIRND